MLFGDRWTPEVYYDILIGIHRLARNGKRITVSSIGHQALVPNNRLKDRLAELQTLGLVDTYMTVTKKGYDFCGDYTKHVDQFLRKYGLHRKE